MREALNIADLLQLAVFAGGMVLIYIKGVGPHRYKSADEIPLGRLAAIWFSIVFILILIQINRPSTPWLMYTPVSWLRPV
ncbi:hypothetical protein [Neorhizobium sp. P12A]|uniref:hypothetical protein n=1 Tax=Neorhizobium sp. P12A TaxID=2268027 RepID=UPI0011EF2B7D|nr:hypothetical protein [Neorhizobium sp. P12A]